MKYGLQKQLVQLALYSEFGGGGETMGKENTRNNQDNGHQ